LIRQHRQGHPLEVLAGVVLILLGGAAVLAIRLSAGPLGLPMFVDDAERAIARLRDGRSVDLKSLSLEWLSEDRRLVVAGEGLRLLDDSGREVAAAERAEIALDGPALLGGRIQPIGLQLSSGWVGVHASDRGWSVAGEPIGVRSGGSGGPMETPASFDEILHQSNIVLSEVLDVLRNVASQLEVREVGLQDIDVIAVGADGDELGRLSEAVGELARTDDGLRLVIAGDTQAPVSLWPRRVSVDIVAPNDFGRLDARFGAIGWSLEAAAAQLGFDDVEGLPADLFFTAALAAETGVERIGLRVEAGPGAAQLGARGVEFDGADLTATYDAAADTLSLNADMFDTGYFDGPFEFTLGEVLAGGGPRPYRLDSPGGALDLRPIFDRPVRLGRVSSDGSIDLDSRSLAVAAVSAAYQATVLRASGDIAYLGASEPGRLPFRLDMAAEFVGPMSEAELLALWPVGLARGARNWVAKEHRKRRRCATSLPSFCSSPTVSRAAFSPMKRSR
jgi:hypothetical protein